MNILFYLLFFLINLSAVSCSPGNGERPAHSAENGVWRELYSALNGDGMYLYATKKPSGLLVYLPYGTDGIDEIRTTAPRISAEGFHIITVVRKTESAADAKIPKDYADIIRTSLARPSYRKRVILMHAKDINLLRPEEINPAPVHGMIILSRSPAEHPALIRVISDLKKPLLLIVSGLTDSLADYKPGIIQLIRANSGLRSDPFPGSLTEDRVFLDFLELVRYSHKWMPAADAFPGGCSYTDRKKAHLKSYYVNAKPQKYFCPLFVYAASSGQLYRAEDASEENCIFRLPDKSNFFTCSL